MFEYIFWNTKYTFLSEQARDILDKDLFGAVQETGSFSLPLLRVGGFYYVHHYWLIIYWT